VQPRERSGFELSPADGDLVLNAWSSTVDGCLSEVVRGFVASFANVEATREPERVTYFTLPPAPEERLVVETLDEAIHAVATEHEVPVRVTAIRTPEGGVAGELGLVDSATVEVFGQAPTGVSAYGTRIAPEDGSWICRVVLHY
jgi:SHS2 domain-containing protein